MSESEKKEEKTEDKAQQSTTNTGEITQEKGEEKPPQPDDELGGEENKTTKAFKIIKKVGGGAEGAVYLATHLKSQKTVAIKSINVRNQQEAEKLEQELEFLISLRHDHVVKHYNWFSEKVKTFRGEETRFFVSMEYCENGSLEGDLLLRKEKNQTYEPSELLPWISQICESFTYLHGEGMIHRDIKTENILLAEDYKIAKLCDFGFTKKTEAQLTGTVLGTVVYMAPEIVSNKKYDSAVDLWSLGIVILQLLLMIPQNKVVDVRVKLIKDPDYVKKILVDFDPKVSAICVSCLKIDPVERPTATEIINFIKDPKAKDLEHHDENAIDLEDLSRDGTDPLVVLGNKKAQQFWFEAQFQIEVDWEEFRDQYLKFTEWKRLNKEQERGFKRLLCYEGSDGKKKTNCYKVAKGLTKAGFPFSQNILASIERYSDLSNDLHSKDHDYTAEMTPEDYANARADYLKMIADCDRIFVDPISQETLSVDQHCAPLKIATDEEWTEMMNNSYDMDLEDQKTLQLQRLGLSSVQKPQHDNAIEFLVTTTTKRFIILGPAAAGKTTLMKLLMSKAGTKATRDLNALIPIFVPITTLSIFEKDMDFTLKCIRSSSQNLLKQAVKYPEKIEHFLIQTIRNNKAMMLFDGLDEAATNEDKIEIQHQILSIPQKNGIIVTSRISGFETSEDGMTLFMDYNLAKVQPLSYDVQKQIAKSRGVTDEKFFKSLEGKYNELAKTPLLLSLMISEFKESQSLPNVRADLYQRAINTMITIFFQKNLNFIKESNSETKKEDLMKFLMKLAVVLHEKRTRDFENDLIEENLSDDEFMWKVWKDLKVLVDDGKFSLVILLNDRYRFSHLSFQEYFVARAWSSKNEDSSIISVESNFFGIKSVKFSKKVKEMIIDPWYRETFLLCAGAMEQSDFLAFGKHLLSLYKSQGGLIDSIVYNMIKERPDEEKASYTTLITNLNSEKKLLRLMDGLIHDSDNLREIAVSRIKMYKKKSSKLNKFLVKHLSDDNNYAAESMSLLTIKGDQEMIKLLLEELSLKNEISKKRCCFVLGNITESGDQIVIDKLISILEEQEDQTKQKEILRETIIALGKITKHGDKNVINVLLKHIGDYHVRDVAATALGIISEEGDEEIIEKLTKISNVCEEACIALGKIGIPGDRQIIDTLLKALDSNTFDEIKIIQALSNITKGAMDDEYATEKLLSFIEKGKRRLATRAAAALGEAVEKSDKIVIKTLLDLCDKNTNNRPFVALALGYCSRKGSKKVVAKLLELLSDQNAHHSVRVSAAESITRVARYNDPKVISVLVQRLSDTEEVCIAVSNTLIELAEKGSPEVIDAFIDLLKHPDPGVIQKAVEVLGKIAKSYQEEEIETLTHHGNDLKSNSSPNDSKNHSPQITTLSPRKAVPIITKEEALKLKIQKESNQKVIKALKELIASDSSTEAIKAVSVESLGLIAPPNDEDIITLMSDLLSNSNSVIIKRQCILGLGNIMKSKQNEKTLELLYSVLLSDSETEDACVETLSKIGDMSKMIELFKNVKEARSVLFTVIIHSIRRLRGEDPNYQLSKEHSHSLQKVNCLESVFILVEHAS